MPDSQTALDALRRGGRVLPSLNFLLLLLVFTGSGAALWHGWIDGWAGVFVFVVSGWIVSLCLHEFGHALVAYLGGDHHIAETGYLTLDPLRYTDPLLSIILPAVYILIGGFGLPGGMVYVRTGLLRGIWWDVAVSAAGPFANLVFLAGLGMLFAACDHGEPASDVEAAIAILAYFEATAIVLNLLPIPPLDGFGIIAPFLPYETAAAARGLGGAGFIILALLLWKTSAGAYLTQAGLSIVDGFGIGLPAVYRGSGLLFRW